MHIITVQFVNSNSNYPVCIHFHTVEYFNIHFFGIYCMSKTITIDKFKLDNFLIKYTIYKSTTFFSGYTRNRDGLFSPEQHIYSKPKAPEREIIKLMYKSPIQASVSI